MDQLITTKPIKKNNLRFNEYYDIQEDFDKLYEASKKGQKFTNLLQLITDERNIKLAYRNIKRNKGSKTPGIDNITIEQIAKYDVETFVQRIKKKFSNYHPSKVKRVEIPKPNGKKRPLGIPTIEDRIIQQCIKQVLEPICEAKFHDNSYGFRPNRDTNDAIAGLLKHVNISKLYYIVDVDIKGFFDNVNHGKLLKQMWTMGIRDKKLICIISKMLKAEIKGVGIPDKGTPQGGILSPLLSNIVLNEFDWWISNQWETFETKHDYTPTKTKEKGLKDKGHKYRALRTKNLKEVYIIRYADDFKLICNKRKDAENIYIATQKWLKERLKLDISEEKSKITDIRKASSEFLGFRFKAKKKKGKYVLQSHMTEKAFENCKVQLKKAICEIKTNPTVKNVMKYNSMVLGKQNYYKTATNISLDMRKIAFIINKTIQCRLKLFRTKKGYKSEIYKSLYKTKAKEINVAEVTLFPIANVSHVSPMMFNQKICDYTAEGRNLIHNNLKGYDIKMLRYIMENPVKNRSLEYNDNRISLYVGQKGKCRITGLPLEIGNMEVHHIIPREQNGTDEYKNLIFIRKGVHIMIHAIENEVIQKYNDEIKPDNQILEKINKYRVKVGNTKINIV